MWEELRNMCSETSLTDRKDWCKWLLGKSGVFSVKSMYHALKINQVKCPLKNLWFIKVLLKIKVFLWLLFKKSILTRDVLKHRGWEGSDTFLFCSEKESIGHLFVHCSMAKYGWSVAQCALDIRTDFDFNSVSDIINCVFRFPSSVRSLVAVGVASVVWSLWKTRNAACFNNFFPYDPTSVLAQSALSMNWWADLQIRGLRGLQHRGARMQLRFSVKRRVGTDGA
uniref:Uncharacterized protein n=1 Tax=Avena sativa TaxID=4498 RepID=A0ACD5TEX8_AVESA